MAIILWCLSVILVSQQLFLNTILEDIDRDSYFIVVNIKMKDVPVSIAVQNQMLHRYCKSVFNDDLMSYKKRISNIILSNEHLEVDSIIFNYYCFPIKVVNKDRISTYSKENIIKKYFKNGYFNNKYSENIQGAVISRLFDLRIGVKPLSYNGKLYIHEFK